MTGQLVSFDCPTHGHLLDAPASSVVKCGRCKGDVALKASPEAPILPPKPLQGQK